MYTGQVHNIKNLVCRITTQNLNVLEKTDTTKIWYFDEQSDSFEEIDASGYSDWASLVIEGAGLTQNAGSYWTQNEIRKSDISAKLVET